MIYAKTTESERWGIGVDQVLKYPRFIFVLKLCKHEIQTILIWYDGYCNTICSVLHSSEKIKGGWEECAA